MSTANILSWWLCCEVCDSNIQILVKILPLVANLQNVKFIKRTLFFIVDPAAICANIAC